jgi:hypothetical protein
MFQVQVDRPGKFVFRCDHCLPKMIIVGHNGRVILKKGYKNQGKPVYWKAPVAGTYLFKLWTYFDSQYSKLL